MTSLSLIVPAYNSSKFIKSSLREYNRVFSGKFSPFEIIVVCNACKDNTFEVCNSLKEEFPLRVINTPKRGKGNAILTGFPYAKGEIIGFIDSDNPFDLNEVLMMLTYIGDYDMVIVTKFKNLSKYQTSITRRFFSIAGAMVFRVLFGMNFKDTQAGAKFMKKTLWDSLKKPFVSKGFEFDMELLYKAGKKRAKIKEYYIHPKTTDFTTVKLRILPGMLKRLFKLRILNR